MLRDADHRQNAEFINREKCIAYILEHRFAEGEADDTALSDNAADSLHRRIDDEKSYADQLEKTDDAEILRIYRGIKNEAVALRRESYAAMEPFLFFNQPSADADLAYWLDVETWTAEQAAALSMGKEPSVVNAESMRGPLRSSKVRFTYRNRSDAILSAVQSGSLSTNIQPKAFIAWATQKNWDIPAALQNWVKLPTYDQLLQRVSHLEAENARLESERKFAMTQSIQELDPRLQRTFYKMILSMAIARYNHRVDANSRGPTHIVDDSEQLLDDRLALKVDAVRGALQKASKYLGVESNSINTPKWIRMRR